MCGGGFSPPTQKIGHVVMVGVWWNVIDVLVCLLVLSRLCCTSSIVCEIPVGLVKISRRKGILEEQDGVVVGVFWPLSASGPLSILNTDFGSSCHTPKAHCMLRVE